MPHSDAIGLFSRNLATHLIGKADGLEAQALACADSDPLGATWCLGASDFARILADALERDPGEAEDHDWDCTPADLHDDYGKEAE